MRRISRENMRLLVRRSLYPAGWVVAVCVMVSAAALTAVFALGLEETALAYAVYPLSAYALTVLVLALIPALPVLVRRVKEHRLFSLLLDDKDRRERLSMRAALGVSVGYAVFKLAAGWYYGSVWFMAVAVYYIVLAVMRYLILRGAGRLGSGADGWRLFRLTGYLMLALTVAISGMAVQMVRDNQAYMYPGFIIYASAAYTFYSLTLAVMNLFRIRRQASPVQAAARALTLAGALMAIFALQTGMIARFGTGDELFRLVMNALTGGAVCIAVLVMGVLMAVYGGRMIRRTDP